MATTVPGITEQSASFIIAEIGVDMAVFRSSKRLCSWVGLAPQNNESAGKKKSVQSVSLLKTFISPVRKTAIKDKMNPYFKYKYGCIKKRRRHKRAVIAIARMMLTCLYHMFQEQEVFNPADTDYSAIPEQMYQKFQAQYDRNAIMRLEKRGFTAIPPAVTA